MTSYIKLHICIWEKGRKRVIEIIFIPCYANGYCSVSLEREFYGLCFFSAVTGDVRLHAYVERDVTCSSILRNIESRKWESG